MWKGLATLLGAVAAIVAIIAWLTGAQSLDTLVENWRSRSETPTRPPIAEADRVETRAQTPRKLTTEDEAFVGELIDRGDRSFEQNQFQKAVAWYTKSLDLKDTQRGNLGLARAYAELAPVL